MALYKPFVCLIGSPSFNKILKFKSKTDILYMNTSRSVRNESKDKFFLGSSKSNTGIKSSSNKFGLNAQRNLKNEDALNVHIENNPLTFGVLWKPFLFSIGFSATSIGACAIWQYENIRQKSMNILRKPGDWASELFRGYNKKHLEWRQRLHQMWNNLDEGKKIFVPICFLNILVFLAWRVKKFQPTMIKYFMTNPGSKVLCWPMIFSTFSHYHAIHLGLNMFVLYSFSTPIVHVLGKEQFLGLYLSAGAWSSFASLFFKVLSNSPGVSLGASGAIMAIIGYVCSRNPEAQLYLVFLPMLKFSAGTGLKCLIAFDTAGLLCRWKYFDHAGHLGGVLCGISWFYWGNQYIWKKKEPLLDWWHKLRNQNNK